MSAATIPGVTMEDLDAEPVEERGRGKLIVLLLVLLVVAAAAAWYFLFAGPADGVEEVDGDIVTVEPMTTTLGRSSLYHARVAMGVVLVEGESPAVIEPRVALLKDALLRELSQMDAEQVRSAEGSDALREALTADAKEIWGEEVVRRVVLTELLIN